MPCTPTGTGSSAIACWPSKACHIEIDVLNKPIGRQDQYAAAFGGINYIRFNSDDTVDVEPVPCRPETLSELEARTLAALHGSDPRRQHRSWSGSQAERPIGMEVLRRMRDLAGEMRSSADSVRGRPRPVRTSACTRAGS